MQISSTMQIENSYIFSTGRPCSEDSRTRESHHIRQRHDANCEKVKHAKSIPVCDTTAAASIRHSRAWRPAPNNTTRNNGDCRWRRSRRLPLAPRTRGSGEGVRGQEEHSQREGVAGRDGCLGCTLLLLARCASPRPN